MLLEAVPAVDGPLAVRLEGNLGFLPTVRAGDLVHLAGGPVIATTPIVVSSVCHGYPFLWVRRVGPGAGAGIGTGGIYSLVQLVVDGVSRVQVNHRT